ncbi:hypothetical protein [Oryza sativa Japonica Group]|uniref:Uncharacterized protein n=1 Tax=Oryza sativa subsp. japonica TaxID=39947 RepID=Q5N9P8_ORYSJ|nr:hypothetical protein [Oryza sativa Japonica Group]
MDDDFSLQSLAKTQTLFLYKAAPTCLSALPVPLYARDGAILQRSYWLLLAWGCTVLTAVNDELGKRTCTVLGFVPPCNRRMDSVVLKVNANIGSVWYKSDPRAAHIHKK